MVVKCGMGARKDGENVGPLMGEVVLSSHSLGEQTPANWGEKLKRQQPVSNNGDSREHLTVSKPQGGAIHIPWSCAQGVPFTCIPSEWCLQSNCCGFSDPGIISQNSQNPG